MNKLVYEHDGKRVEVPLSSKPVSLGRGDEADHKLPTKAASRIHAQVFLREGGWWLEDLASSNGTILNGKVIEKPTPLTPGDVITVGEVKLKYEGESAKPRGAPDNLLARLLYQPEKGKPPVELIVRDRVTIGRKPDNDLQIDTKAISGHHCEVINRQGAYLLRDLGSSNGTMVGKQAVTEHTLRNGEIVVLGKTVILYFVDPAGAAPATPAAPAPATPAPASPAAKLPAPVSLPSSAASASDRGKFAPVSAEPAKKPPRNPLPHVLVGLVLGALFLMAGWLTGEVIAGMRAPRAPVDDKPKPEAALADAAFSFEGDIDNKGNPDGWLASFEAGGGASAELVADPVLPYDGARSLCLKAGGVQGTATLILETSKARPIDLGGQCGVTLFARAEGGQRLAVALSVVGENRKAHTVAAGSFTGLRGGEWSKIEFDGRIVAPLPANGTYRLLVSGNFSVLWIDRLEISKLTDSTEKPFRRVTEAEVTLRLDDDLPVQSLVENGRNAARFTPRLLAHGNEGVSDHDLWAVQSLDGERVVYNAMLARNGDAASVELHAATRPAVYFQSNGVALTWSLRKGNSADSLAVEIELPLPPGADIAVSDRRGMPLIVTREHIHTFAYSTISEVMVNDTDLAVSFPEGAVVWFDISRPGRLIVVVRAALGDTRRSMRAVVYNRPLMFARQYEALYDEARRMWEAGHGSAAKTRLLWLLAPNRPHRELGVISRARDLMEKLQGARIDLVEDVEQAWQIAERTQTGPSVEAAIEMVRRYTDTWPGEADIPEMEARLKRLNAWKVEIDARKRSPADMQKAEAMAKRLWLDAQQANKNSHVLLAMLLLENILRDYGDTSMQRDASVMYEQLTAKLKDPVERDKAIDAELAGIDEDIKFKDYARAHDRCVKLFRRFPDTPRNRDIMKRLRQVEDAFRD
ncbi:MAG: FHA domain-containing protein [Planctomycetes bacterium]|nr:FHA domain-containing protein [Planctomycetota bacterium]MCW8135930.1 FHA domain-containing protein [Planctomycetota bacterium]